MTRQNIHQVGLAVAHLRKLHGWSLRKLSEETKKYAEQGVSTVQISRIEKLESSPTEDSIWVIAHAFKVPVSMLFGETSLPQSLLSLQEMRSEAQAISTINITANNQIHITASIDESKLLQAIKDSITVEIGEE